MARTPTQRRSFQEDSTELNLTPMMNLIAMLIPVLLLSAAFVEIGVLNVSAPAISSDSSSSNTPEDVPLNLRITVTENGYSISGSQGPIVPPGINPPSGGGPTIPVVKKRISCIPYVGTWPPPRSKNQGSPKCTKDKTPKEYWVYDNEMLGKALSSIKDEFPLERRVIVAAEPDIEYDTIVEVMDTSREEKLTTGDVRTLFDEIVLSPAVM